MNYEEFIECRNRYRKVIQGIKTLNIDCIDIEDNLNTINQVVIQITRESFKKLYINIRYNKIKAGRFIIDRGVAPLYIENNMICFNYLYCSIEFLFKTTHSMKEFTIDNHQTKNSDALMLINML